MIFFCSVGILNLGNCLLVAFLLLQMFMLQSRAVFRARAFHVRGRTMMISAYTTRGERLHQDRRGYSQRSMTGLFSRTRKITAIGSSTGVDDVLHCTDCRSKEEPFPKNQSHFNEKGWRKIDWARNETHHRTEINSRNNFSVDDKTHKSQGAFVREHVSFHPMYHPNPSPVEVIMVRSKRVHVKRDDLLKLPGSHISGNKARKLLSLAQLSDGEPFPRAVVSYGGAQSNAMVAIAAIVHHQNSLLQENRQNRKNSDKIRFIYYTKNLPRWLREQPSGNLLRAMSLGMELMELHPDRYSELFGGPHGGSSHPPSDLPAPIPGDSLWIPQGAACAAAREGVKRLAKEIVDYWHCSHSNNVPPSPMSVVLPAGTGTVAFYLHREVQALLHDENRQHLDITVVAVPVVGDADYTSRQMLALDEEDGATYHGNRSIPHLLQSRHKRGFGKPSEEILDAFNYLKQDCGMLVDLLYGASAWASLLERQNWYPNDPSHPLFGRQILYINCGGLEGISSQMTRYRHQGFILPRQT